jgi:hypothetical protein
MTFTKPVLKSQKKTTVYNFPKMVFGDPSGRPYGQRFAMSNVTVTIIGDIKDWEMIVQFEGDMPSGRQTLKYTVQKKSIFKWNKCFPAPIEKHDMWDLASVGNIFQGKYDASKSLESLGCYHYNTEGSLVDDFRDLSSLEEWFAPSYRSLYIQKGYIKV